MRIHIYDANNKNKIAQINGDEFTQVQISHNIDDLSTARLEWHYTLEFDTELITGLENIYIEDDDGTIIFGGVYVKMETTPTKYVMVCMDHRFLLSKLIIDKPVIMKGKDEVLDTVEHLMELALKKRNIPIIFDREGSAIGEHTDIELRFEVGETIASCLSKIIEVGRARWQMRYEKTGTLILGKLIVRSIGGVTPEGAGISQSKDFSETGEIIDLFYGKGKRKGNVIDFIMTQDFTDVVTRALVGVKVGENADFYESKATEADEQVEAYYGGRMEKFVTDYNATSKETAEIISAMHKFIGRGDVMITLDPTFKTQLKCGDRVHITLDTPVIVLYSQGKKEVLNLSARIDSITLTRQSGCWDRRLLANNRNPQTRIGSSEFLKDMRNTRELLETFNKHYLGN